MLVPVRPWLLAALLLLVWDAPAVAERPNVLFMVSDDLNTQFATFGNPRVPTPHLDRLARRGVRFLRAYCQVPLGNPSRSSILSGLRPDSCRVLDNATRLRDAIPNLVTLPQLFRQHGYRTLRVGKVFHAAVPGQIGADGLDDPLSWDEVFNPRGCDKGEAAGVINLTPRHDPGSSLAYLASRGSDAEQTDGLVASQAIELLRANADRPFFLAVGFYRPHVPCIAPAPRFRTIPLGSIRIPELLPGDRPAKPRLALTSPLPHEGVAPDDLGPFIQAYEASITLVDHQVGRLLVELDRLELAARTIVVFCSDHGFHLGEHGCWQKETLYEPAVRVPLLVAAPDIASAGQTTQALVELVDLYPTLADLAGLTGPAGLEGISLRPLLEQPARGWKRAAFSQLARGQPPDRALGRALRTERFRYIEWDDARAGVELYDHNRDPSENVNRADDPELAEIRTQLRQMLTAGWRAALPQ